MTGVDVLISILDVVVAMVGMVLASGGVDVAIASVLVAMMGEVVAVSDVVDAVHTGNKRSHVFPSMAGMAYAVAQMRVSILAFIGSMPPSDCCTDAR